MAGKSDIISLVAVSEEEGKKLMKGTGRTKSAVR